MLLFCPTCFNILTISLTDAARNRLECRTCPFELAISDSTPIYSRQTYPPIVKKEDVFGGPGAWDNAQKARVPCPKEGCLGVEAAFLQVQIRSADEPMTSFYKCMACGGQWREN